MGGGRRMSVAELKERHVAATETVNTLKERLKQRRRSLLDTDGVPKFLCSFFYIIFAIVFLFFLVFLRSGWFLCLIFTVAGYARSQNRTPVSFGPTDLVCCRTLQGHTGKVYIDIYV